MSSVVFFARGHLNYVPALDGLRAAAAIAVIAFHVHFPGFSGGFIGVEVFFVLSGYLITSLLMLEIKAADSLRICRFWWRRIVRLYPELLLLLACCVAAAIMLYPGREVWREVSAAALYISNYFALAPFGDPTFTRHTWSLAVEMQFYLVWPYMVLAFVRLRRGTAILSLVFLFLAATWWRMHAHSVFGIDYAYKATDARMSGLIMGSLLAFGRWRPSLHAANAMALVAILALGLLTWHLSFADRGGWSTPIIDIASAMLILALPIRECWLARPFSHPIVVQLGIWSYGIYLWHYPIARVARHHLDAGVAFIAVLLASTALAALSYQYIARPAKRLLTRRPPAAARPVRTRADHQRPTA